MVLTKEPSENNSSPVERTRAISERRSYARFPDPSLTLSIAQHALAREYGFENP
jgi:hypothetical protein